MFSLLTNLKVGRGLNEYQACAAYPLHRAAETERPILAGTNAVETPSPAVTPDCLNVSLLVFVRVVELHHLFHVILGFLVGWNLVVVAFYGGGPGIVSRK